MDIIGTAEAARILGLTQRMVVYLIKEGELEAKKIGPNWAIDKNSVESHKARREAQQGQKPDK